MSERFQAWLDGTVLHHRWMANGPLWWLCATCRESKQQEREQQVREQLQVMERNLRIERANNPTMLDLVERLGRIEKRMERWERFGRPTGPVR